MYVLARLSAGALSAVALFALLLFACPTVLGVMGLSESNLSEAIQFLQREWVRGDALDQRYVILHECMRQKQEVVQSLIEDKIALLRAAVRVRDLCADCPELLVNLSRRPDGSHETAPICRNLIGWAEVRLRGDSERSAAVRERLERELEYLLHDQKLVVLP